jgi:hypothetical protein
MVLGRAYRPVAIPTFRIDCRICVGLQIRTSWLCSIGQSLYELPWILLSRLELAHLCSRDNDMFLL